MRIYSTGSIISVPNRGTRPFSNLIISSTAPTTQLAGSPASPIVSTVVGPRTPSVHQQPSQVLQTQSSSMSHQFGGNIGLQQPPTLRLERARPNEVGFVMIIISTEYCKNTLLIIQSI